MKKIKKSWGGVILSLSSNFKSQIYGHLLSMELNVGWLRTNYFISQWVSWKLEFNSIPFTLFWIFTNSHLEFVFFFFKSHFSKDISSICFVVPYECFLIIISFWKYFRAFYFILYIWKHFNKLLINLFFILLLLLW